MKNVWATVMSRLSKITTLNSQKKHIDPKPKEKVRNNTYENIKKNIVLVQGKKVDDNAKRVAFSAKNKIDIGL